MPAEMLDSNGNPVRDRNTLYGNNAYYLFFRYFQIAYSRLQKIREAADDLAMSSAGYRRLQNQKTAESLDLLTKNDAGKTIHW
jgi:histone deacetylase complex regulatory component SIN3